MGFRFPAPACPIHTGHCVNEPGPWPQETAPTVEPESEPEAHGQRLGRAGSTGQLEPSGWLFPGGRCVGETAVGWGARSPTDKAVC